MLSHSNCLHPLLFLDERASDPADFALITLDRLTRRQRLEDAALVGDLYARGPNDSPDGLPPNYLEAAQWYRRAADQGNPSAQNKIFIPMIVGLALGTLFFVLVDPRILVLGIAAVTLIFTARYFLRDRLRLNAVGAPVQPVKALVCGTLAGFTTFIAHSGAPPIAMYLLPRGLGKTMFAGTTVALLTFSNCFKIMPYIWFGIERPQAFWQALPLLPAIPLGVWLGKRLHDRLDEQRLYFWCYVLVGAAGAKLLADSLRQMLVA